MAWSMLCFGRDYMRSAAETRLLEKDQPNPEHNGDSLIGWPDYQRGRVAIIFSTLFAPPLRTRAGEWDKIFYSDYKHAHARYMEQARLYHQLAESKPDFFSLIFNQKDLKAHLDHWQDPEKSDHPVGLVLLMEGADGILSTEELPEWYEMGLRLIGPAWAGTRYAGGTNEPGPLTDDGRHLLKAMAEFNFTLDLSHMDKRAALEALDLYAGPIAATHGTCAALVPGFENNRLFTDRLIRGVIERDGCVGLIPLNSFLKAGWKLVKGSRREEVSLEVFVNHIDHVCQLAGDAKHVGIGTDFDGGFGLQSVPPEIDTIADLQKVIPLLISRGYSEKDASDILGGNWLTFLQRNLP